MTLQQAYKKWSEDPMNLRLFLRTKNDFKMVFNGFDMSAECSALATSPRVLKDFITNTAKAPRPSKASAASILTQVLEYAHKTDPENNAKPIFEFSELTAERKMDSVSETKKEVTTTGVPSNVSPKKTETKKAAPLKSPVPPENPTPPDTSKVSQEVPAPDIRPTTPKSGATAPKAVVQIDPDTLSVVNTYPSANAAKRAAGVSSGLDYSIKNSTIKAGFYWAFEEDYNNDLFKPAPTSAVIAARLRKDKPIKKTKPARKKKTTKHVEHGAVSQQPSPASSPAPAPAPETSPALSPAAAPLPPLSPENTAEMEEMKVISTDLVTRIDTKALATISDDELIDELDRRQFFGQLSKKVAEHRYVTYTLESTEDPNGEN